jgi:hypothetical protein
MVNNVTALRVYEPPPQSPMLLRKALLEKHVEPLTAMLHINRTGIVRLRRNGLFLE